MSELHCSFVRGFRCGAHRCALFLVLPLTGQLGWSQVVSGSMNVQGNGGAARLFRQSTTSTPGASLQPTHVHASGKPLRYFRSPFLYLLIGSTRALLMDREDVAGPGQMLLAN